ncbi:hypothetical protein [Heyndrickxia sporothermodurans]|uniref:hypothetical protein n=1 Tax=Heyndrickxia sporothermodurans TaxID=46224 RepID=UPI000D37F108|nr:hypothetical protein [Heyndrickxia sporothermodurans]PTY92881.1 hypothetical protein B5V90_02045 [Heyndrickxia sporothermodurans]
MKEPVENKAAEVKETSTKAAAPKATNKSENVTLDDKQIQQWKKQWGKIFKTTVGGEAFIWRKLKRKEYVEIMSNAEVEEAEEEVLGSRIYKRQERITKLVVLFPTDIESRIEENAGLATSISDEVIAKSGFDVSATEEL